MASLAFLLVYAMVNLGHLRIAGQTGAKRWILICSVVLNLALFALLFIQTILNHETLTWISVIALLIISFLVELAWRKKNKRNLHWLGKKIVIYDTKSRLLFHLLGTKVGFLFFSLSKQYL